ncbi:MAG TPA: hypothetical protein VNZ22_07715 [Bacillota bacterium]|nr:hypothetical protein [Bacillota bacterium]
MYEASLLPWFAAHLLPDGNPSKRLLVLTPPPAQAPHSSLVHMFESIRRSYPWTRTLFLESVAEDEAWNLNWAAARHALQQSGETAQPVVLLGTAFSFVHLLDHMAGQNQRIKLPSGSRVLETGGYKGRSRSLPKAELHALITACLGIPSTHIVCEYGMSELSSQAYDRVVGAAGNTPAARIFHFPPWARSQIVSPETGREVAEGETGLMRVFDLANVYSVMAIQTEDLGIRRDNGFELIGRAVLAEPRGCSLMAG